MDIVWRFNVFLGNKRSLGKVPTFSRFFKGGVPVHFLCLKYLVLKIIGENTKYIGGC